MSKKLLGLIVFGVAFGFVEAAVVYYLRQLPDFSRNVEMDREAATILMLVGISVAAGTGWKQKIGAFLITFSLWDLFYYIFLKLLLNWPTSLLSQDIYFLIPVPWIGPVIIPVIIFTLLLILGIRLYMPKSKV
jgi:hypothetical protein